MSLNKKDLENIKDTVKEVMEPMMIASQKEFDGIKGQFEKIDERFDKLDSDMKILKQGQEDITLRLDNVAYRFELVALTQRVEKLEKMVGAPKSRAPQV